MRFSDLEHARVGILGIGREGQAVWRQIRQRFPQKPLWLFAEKPVDAGISALFDPAVDHCHCGRFERAGLQVFDVLVRSAGVSPYRPVMQDLKAANVVFTSASNLWFAEHPTAKTICVSGTMGKSTTVALITHLLKSAGVNARMAGNIGRPMLACDDTGVGWWVIELSSYQLVDLDAKPEIAVLLNLSEEHIDWHGSVACYYADKLQLARLAATTRLIANYSNPALRKELPGFEAVNWFNDASGWSTMDGGVARRGKQYVSVPQVLASHHNRQNLAAALTVIDLLGLEIPNLERSLAVFEGLPHRLQLIGEKAGIRYIDDSISTTPVSVKAALETLGYDDVVLLLGGLDRGIDWQKFAAAIAPRPPFAMITMPCSGPAIMQQLKNGAVHPPGGLHNVACLADAVTLAQSLVPDNGCILLSPGAPSFPQFRDFEDRGQQFASYAGIEKDL